MTPQHPWLVNDEDAEAALIRLITTAIEALSGLPQPTFVAASPNKHDDMGHHLDWRAVQVGQAYWERSAYSLSVVEERSLNLGHLTIARSVLDCLEDGGWRSLAETAFGVTFFDEIIGLVLVHDVTWFVLSSTGMGQHSVAFLLDQTGAKLLDVGDAERLDVTLGRARAFRLASIWQESWAALSSLVPSFPFKLTERPLGDAELARRRLAELIGAISVLLRAIPGHFRYVAVADWPGQRTVLCDSIRVVSGPFNSASDRERYYEELRRRGAVFVALDGLLDVLSVIGWTELFRDGLRTIEQKDMIAFIAHQDEVWLAGAGTVFALDSNGRISVVGACDDPDWSTDRVTLYLFDGRILSPPPLQWHGQRAPDMRVQAGPPAVTITGAHLDTIGAIGMPHADGAKE